MTATDTDAGATMSLDELRAHQLANLKTTVTTVYEKVPHYRKAFDDLGVVPSDITSLDDIAKLPFTNKQDLRENYPFGLFAVPREDVARIHASSGTTGLPTVVGYTQNDLDVWSGLIKHSILGAGGRPGQMLHNAYGYGLFTGGLGVHGAERHGFTVVPISGGQTERQVQLIQDFQPDIITATPTYLLTILDEFHKQGIDPTSTSLKVAICGAEPWTDEMRREIERSFAIDAVDIYGLSEVMGPGVACESAETKDGPTIWEDHFYPEIVDPFTGEVLPDGEEGELVFTSLTKEALPIIRYRTHDLASLLPGTAHPNFRRISRITGRSDDLIIIRGVNVYPANVESVLFEFEHLSPHFQLVLTRPGRMDEVTVEVECREGVDAAQREGLGVRVASRIKERLGVSSTVDVKDPGSLPRSVGKLKRIIDRRENIR
ncbi:Putative phenylacetate-CoA ligase [Mycobacteroides abscessus subsp. abscessus]|uniref:Phenylacetate-coenzyme A ligase n=1 Tax=Brevibacterium casei S18 TaxID=1229781 RepID=K9AFD5_9MICO|nr:phenylacetate--CoA ligase PaaK [Brevibacterium casei]EKU46039.1 phenylacetate:CoA ligase [Brevibacterium casei S18]MCT2358731.1 phenylacetate--CoA ligase [Brevibacterium casei]NJE66977.1 phenylacetate--CoA ligase [Brevibacterium sp. LS14]SIG54714.1 Putative phenylacetate-CoA ligase [Mycobacteroides abscessus subsp. abscessus]